MKLSVYHHCRYMSPPSTCKHSIKCFGRMGDGWPVGCACWLCRCPVDMLNVSTGPQRLQTAKTGKYGDLRPYRPICFVTTRAKKCHEALCLHALHAFGLFWTFSFFRRFSPECSVFQPSGAMRPLQDWAETIQKFLPMIFPTITYVQHMPTCPQAHMHTHVPTHAHTRAHRRTCTHTHAHTCPQVPTGAHACPQVHT